SARRSWVQSEVSASRREADQATDQIVTALDAKKEIQEILLTAADGIFGPKTEDALRLLLSLPPQAQWPLPSIITPTNLGIHKVRASSFADPADVRAFKHCTANGSSDQECFKVGDDGRGFGGLTDCTDESKPYVALPPEKWLPRFGSAQAAAGGLVIVSVGS